MDFFDACKAISENQSGQLVWFYKITNKKQQSLSIGGNDKIIQILILDNVHVHKCGGKVIKYYLTHKSSPDGDTVQALDSKNNKLRIEVTNRRDFLQHIYKEGFSGS